MTAADDETRPALGKAEGAAAAALAHRTTVVPADVPVAVPVACTDMNIRRGPNMGEHGPDIISEHRRGARGPQTHFKTLFQMNYATLATLTPRSPPPAAPAAWGSGLCAPRPRPLIPPLIIPLPPTRIGPIVEDS